MIFWKAWAWNILLNRNWQGLLCTICRFRQSTIDSTFPEISAILKQCGWGEVWTLNPESTIQLIIQYNTYRCPTCHVFKHGCNACRRGGLQSSADRLHRFDGATGQGRIRRGGQGQGKGIQGSEECRRHPGACGHTKDRGSAVMLAFKMHAVDGYRM